MAYNMVRQSSLPLLCTVVSAILAYGCGSQQSQAPASPQTAPTASSSFTATAPAALMRSNPATTKVCSADVINGSESAAQLQIAKSAKLIVTGWAVDDIAGTTPPEIYVELIAASGSTRYYARAARITKRPDVAKAHNNPAFENSGYDLEGDLTDVAPGVYSVQVAQSVAAGGTLCDTRHKVEIR